MGAGVPITPTLIRPLELTDPVEPIPNKIWVQEYPLHQRLYGPWNSQIQLNPWNIINQT